MQTNLALLALLASVVFVAGCTQPGAFVPETQTSGQSELTPMSEVPAGGSEIPEMIVEGEAVEPGIKEFTLEAVGPSEGAWQFRPSRIEVNKGDTVRITIVALDNGVGNGHGFALTQFGVNEVNIKTGSPRVVEFVADREGTFTFFCSTFCGVGHPNQRGVLVVSG